MYFQAISSVPILALSYLLLVSTSLSSSSTSNETHPPTAPHPVSISVQSIETLDSESTANYKIVRVLVAMDFNYTEKVKDSFSPQALVFSVLGAAAPSEIGSTGKSQASSKDSMDKLNPTSPHTIWEASNEPAGSEMSSTNKVERKREAIFPPGMENLFKTRVTRSESVSEKAEAAIEFDKPADTSTRVHTHADDHQAGDSNIDDHDHENHHHRHARDGVTSSGTRATPCLKASHTHEDHHKDGDSGMLAGHTHEDHDHEHTPRCRRHLEEQAEEEAANGQDAEIRANDSMESGELSQDLNDYGSDDEELAKFLNINIRSKVSVAKENRATTAVKNQQESQKPLAGNDVTIIQG